MGFASDILEIKVDFPAFGNPKRPTSAINLSSNWSDSSSPFSPSVVFLGALLVDDLNLAFPNPPFPPETTSKRSPSFFKSAISSSVDSSKTTVPTGPFKIMSLASLPCLFLHSPVEPFLAWYFFCNLIN